MDENPQPLPLRHRRKVQLAHIIAGESVGDASKAAGYASIQTGSRALSDTRTRLHSIMNKHGLSEEALIRDYLVPLMNATKSQFFAHEGVVTDERIVEDNGTRDSAFVTACKLRGLFPREQSDGPAHLNISINNSVVNE